METGYMADGHNSTNSVTQTERPMAFITVK